MPQIIVTADTPTENGQPPIMFRERVNVSDFQSGHFAAQLVERLGWAVEDADAVDRRPRHRASRSDGSDAPQRPPRSASVVTTAS